MNLLVLHRRHQLELLVSEQVLDLALHSLGRFIVASHSRIFIYYTFHRKFNLLTELTVHMFQRLLADASKSIVLQDVITVERDQWS